MKKIIICIAIVLFCFFSTDLFAKSYSDKKPVAEKKSDSDVIIYITKRCGYCVRAKNFLRENKISFFEIDINKSVKGREQFKALGGRGVPLIIIGDIKISGFNQPAIKSALGL